MAQTQAPPVRSTTDHDEIERWIEERQGAPAIIESTWDGNTAVLKVDFGEPDNNVIEISWDEFFRIFDESDLEFLHQDERSDGTLSRAYEFAERG